MNSLRHVGIRIKTMIPSAILIVALGIVSLLAVYALAEHEASLRAIDNTALRRLTLIDDLLATGSETRSDLLGISLMDSAALPAADVQSLRERIARGLERMKALSGQMQAEWGGDARGQALMEQVQTPLALFGLQAEQALLSAAVDPAQGSSVGQQAAVPYAQFREALLLLEEYQQGEIARSAETAYGRLRALNIAIVAVSLLLTVPGAVVAVLIGTRGISRPILGLGRAMNRLEEGDLETGIPGTDRRDEIGGMARAVEVFRNSAAESGRLNRALQESEERLRQVASSLREVIWLRDARTLELLYVNPAYETVWGRTRESFAANPVAGFVESVHPEDQARVVAAMQREYEGVPFNDVYRIVRPDGEVRWIMGQTFPITDERGDVCRVVARAEDITERKKAEVEIAQRHAALLQANEELDSFAHTVAHDLRQPLAVIIAYSEVLQRYAEVLTEPERVEYLQIIGQHGRKMSNVVREILLLSSVRKADAERSPLDMRRIVEEVQKRLADMIAEYHGEIVVPDDWPWALGKSPWIEEVWINYVSNALKYGGQPPRVVLGADSLGDGVVRFWVRDNGPGARPDEVDRLFAPFTRLEKVRVEGHGLGLSVVRYIVEKLGGQVGVEPSGEPEGGSVFYFTLPAMDIAGHGPP